MTTVRARNGKAPRQSVKLGNRTGEAPDRGVDDTVEGTASLEEKTSVPRRWKRQSETDPVLLTVHARSALEHRLQPAVRRQRCGSARSRRSGRNPLRGHLADGHPG